VAQPINQSLLGFEAKPRNRRGDFDDQITKPKLLVLRPKRGNPPPPWFWGPTKNPSTSFEAKPRETVATSFEAKLEKAVVTCFEAKPEKTVEAGFEAKLLEIITGGFEAKPPETILFIPTCKRLNDYCASNA
jgi:hypothetical protein